MGIFKIAMAQGDRRFELEGEREIAKDYLVQMRQRLSETAMNKPPRSRVAMPRNSASRCAVLLRPSNRRIRTRQWSWC